MTNVIHIDFRPKYAPQDIKMLMVQVHRFLEALDTLEAIRAMEKMCEEPIKFNPNF